MSNGIVISEYCADWPQLFADEAGVIAQSMGKLALRIEHVGSTSIPGMSAKPIIDIQVSVEQLGQPSIYIKALNELGYEHIALPPPPKGSALVHDDSDYPFFQKPASWPSTHHVHLCVQDTTLERDHIIFRDFLRDHTNRAVAYIELKKKLATEYKGTVAFGIEQYTFGKTEFIASVLDDALNMGYRA